MGERDFKGIWIPKEVWLDERLDAITKILLCEIDSLDSSEDGCYASNEYLANFCGCSVSKVSSSISTLIKLGYLKIKKFDGRTRYIKSCLLNFGRQPSKFWKAAFQKNEDNNIYNNINNNIKEKEDIIISSKKKKNPTLEEIKKFCEEKKIKNIDQQYFFDYYEVNNWRDGNGDEIGNWKQVLLTWNKKELEKEKIKNENKPSGNYETVLDDEGNVIGVIRL